MSEDDTYVDSGSYGDEIRIWERSSEEVLL